MTNYDSPMRYFSVFHHWKKDMMEILNIRHSDPSKEPMMIRFIDGWSEELWDDGYYGYLFKRGKAYDFISFIGAKDCWLLSERAKDLIGSHVGSEQVRFYPLPLRSKNGKFKIDGYYFPIWKRVPDCVIKQLSAVDEDVRIGARAECLGLFLSLSLAYPNALLTLNADIVGDSMIFRIGRMEGEIIVREDVVKLIEKNKLTGFSYESSKHRPIAVVSKDELIHSWRKEGRNEKEIAQLLKIAELE